MPQMEISIIINFYLGYIHIWWNSIKHDVEYSDNKTYD